MACRGLKGKNGHRHSDLKGLAWSGPSSTSSVSSLSVSLFFQCFKEITHLSTWKSLKKKNNKLLSPENTPPLLCFLLLNYYSIFKLIFRYHFLWDSGVWTPELKIPCYIHPQTCTQRCDYVFICIFVWIMLIFPAKK